MAANLTFIAVKARKSIRFGLAGIIVFLILRSLFGFAVNIYQQVFPKKIPPNAKFGALSSLPFPQKQGLPTFEYKIELPSGLPTLAETGSVYYMPKEDITFQSSAVAKQRSSQLGFTNEPFEIQSTVYKFRHQKLPSTLEMNIVSGIFNISYDLASDPIPLDKQPPATQEAASIVRNYLNRAAILPEDLEGGPITEEFLKVDSQGLSTALSLSESNLIKVNFFRQPVNELEPKTPDPNTSNVWFILSGESPNARQIIVAEYHYFPVDKEQVATYPLKTAAQAIQDLQAGKAYIASLGQNQDGKVTVRRIELAYYDAGAYTPYYQPIIVFKGDRGFEAYLPAVTDQYYGKADVAE